FAGDKGPLALARRNPAMQENAAVLLFLGAFFAADDQLVLLHLDGKIVHIKTRNRNGDAQMRFADLVDVIGGIPLAGGPRRAVERAFELVKPQQKGTVEKGESSAHLTMLLYIQASLVKGLSPPWATGVIHIHIIYAP